ncbi:LysM peptidoglycan-binding domain-containing protein [Frankia sp. CcWB2]
MIARAARQTLARFAGATAAAITAIILIVFGPRLADLPESIEAAPAWFAAAPEQALATIIGVVAWVCLLWLCLGVLLSALSAVPGGVGRLSAALARRIVPRTMRRMLEIGLGVTLVAGVAPIIAAVPASAATGPAGTGVSAGATAALPDLDRPTTVGHPPNPIASFPGLDRPPAGTSAGHTPATPPASSTGPASPTEPVTGAGAIPATSPTPTISVPGLGEAIPVVDLHGTTSAAGSPTRPPSPGSAAGGNPVHTAPDPGALTRLTTAHTTTAGWPDLDRPATTSPSNPAAPGAAITPTPSHPTPSHPTPSGPAAPAASTPARDPIVPPAPRGTGTPMNLPGTDRTSPGVDAAEIVVLRGDSLWSIAARHLGPDATQEQIAAEWPRWWAANSDLIGHDPNLIFPGQRLKPPPGP